MRTTRRGWAALAVVMALALLFAACDDQGATSTTAPPSTQSPATTTTAGTSSTTATTTTAPQALKPYGGEVIFGEDQEAPTLTKHNPTSAGDTWNIESCYRKDL